MTNKAVQPISGVLPIDKSPGMTSHDVVAQVRRVFRPEKVKVGHAGTLDPDATGLLLVCIGPATRLADLLADQGKTYHAHFELGVATTTEDASGDVTSEADASHITLDSVEAQLRALTGAVQQVPPMVSAVHYEGKRLYELARQGVEVERAARTVEVRSIELLDFQSGRHPSGEMIVECGKGTYIRTLCADLGLALGVGGHMTRLRRLRIGVFDVSEALPVEGISRESVEKALLPAAVAVDFLPLRRLSDLERVDILHGRAIDAGAAEASEDDALIRLVDTAGELVALARVDRTLNKLQPCKVLAAAP